MTPAERAEAFLWSLGRYLSVARLYGVEHPTREAAADEAYEKLRGLLEAEPHVTFSFLPDRVVHRDTPLDGLESWPWSERLASVDVQRLEVSRGVRPDEFDSVLRAMASRLAAGQEDGTPGGEEATRDGVPRGEDDGDAERGEEGEGERGRPEPERVWRHARFGTLGMETTDVSREETFFMEEEAEAVEWIHRMAADEGRIPVEETLTLVRSLSVAMRGAHRIVVPFIRLKEADQYTAAHCINVSILCMSLAEAMDFPPVKTRAIGAAGLLHDVGKTRVPTDVLNKPGELDAEEWREMKLHPVHGARILLESGPGLDLPAVVAYEHHVGWQRGGYPDLHYDRKPLPESRLVQVCDFYDAMRSRRRYSEPVEPALVIRTLREVEDGSLDPQFVQPFVALIERWDPSALLTEVRPEGESGDGSPPDGDMSATEEEEAAAGPPD